MYKDYGRKDGKTMGFSDDFMWGAASAAYQVEGAYLEDGKGAGVWDAMSAGHVDHGENGNTACDHYHHYKEDVAIMKQLGLKSYRFSVSWPRVMPKEGVVNQKGIAFYQNLVKELKQAGIEPLCTLFHWNLPMWIQEKGGLMCEHFPVYYEAYVKVVMEALSDQVQYWMTFNEPQIFVGCGYLAGVMPPYVSGLPNEALGVISRNVMLAHGKGVLAIREYAKQAPKVGMAPTGSCITPASDNPKDIEAARVETYPEDDNVFGNAWWADPIVLGTVPKPLKHILSEEDIRLIHQPLDFYAFNIYNSNNYSEIPGREREAGKVIPTGMGRTMMGWPITPECIYWACRFHYERYGLPLLISENGMANCDFIMRDGKVHDPQRIDYIYRYLANLKKAVNEGIPVIGYQYWSIMDNFEWANGYDKRFGLVYIDYGTQKRIIKDSGYTYAEIIAANGENIESA